MKATIESTDQVVTVGGVAARVWEGVTERGVAFVAYIALLQVKSDADNAEFERDCHEHKDASASTLRAIDLRLVL